MIFNSKRQSGKTLYIIKRAVQYQEEYLNNRGKRPVIVVPNERHGRFIKSLILEKYHRNDISVVTVSCYVFNVSYANHRVLVDEGTACLSALVNHNHSELTECTMTVPTFDDPLRELLKELY